MIYKRFRDMKLSALGMGNMRLPVKDGNDAVIDEAATEAILDYCMAHGINYYDTAWGVSQRQFRAGGGQAPAEVSPGELLSRLQVPRL